MGYRIVRFTTANFAELFTESKTFPGPGVDHLVIEKGLPEGAELVDAKVDFGSVGVILLKFSHPSWEGPGAGEAIPYIYFQTVEHCNNPGFDQSMSFGQELQKPTQADAIVQP